MDTEKYRRWLKVRGIENPSESEVARFAKETTGSPYCTLMELLIIAWIDSRGRFAGTRGMLIGKGLWEASDEDLRIWSAAVKRAAFRRGCALLGVEAAWFAFLGLIGVWGLVFSLLAPVSILVCALGVSAGTKLVGSDALALKRAAAREKPNSR
jgi:hypothetical protein